MTRQHSRYKPSGAGGLAWGVLDTPKPNRYSSPLMVAAMGIEWVFGN
jgi:hypothetical protein